MSEPVYFTRLEVENVRCFGPKTTLDLSDGKGNWKKWTVILGDNGTGKTTLLQILAASEKDNRSLMDGHSIGFKKFPGFDHYFQDSKNPKFGEVSIFSTIDSNSFSVNLGFYNDVFDTEKYPEWTKVRGKDELLFLKCFGYGANRSMSSSSLTDEKSDNSDTLFNDDAKLYNAEEWLLQLDYAASKESNIKGFAIKKRNQVNQILIELLPDVEEMRFRAPTKRSFKSTVEFKTPYGWVTIHQLSLGYKTMVAWMVDLAARMFERYPESDNPLAEPAIVLVDEIDLHLHPKWQRKIFDYLSERFPQTQFIVTAHSPLVVQSAPKDANIVLLRKEGDHVIIDNDIKSVQNWRLDQILTSDLFGVESARGPEAEQWLEERKELLQKQSLTAEEKGRLNELNQKARNLPTADNKEDIEAMELIRKAADYLKNQKA
ncbi:MAG: AAA family ATPase [Niastella sp.]|nr:AAA family ATPase [Niastella sp.]